MDYYDYMRLKFTYFLPLILASVLTAQAQSTATTEQSEKKSALDSQLFLQLLLGELNARAEDPGSAFALILDAARKTNDPTLYRRSVQIALQARSGDSSLLAAKAWRAAIPSSREANRYVLQILVKLNLVSETLEPLRRDLSLTPLKDRRQAVWAIPELYEHVSDKQLAATIVQKALSHALQDPDLGGSAWATVGRMWLIAGDTKAALNAAIKGQSMGGRNEHPALLALALVSTDRPQAEILVKKHLAEQPRPEFQMAWVKVLLRAKRDSEAQTALQTINASHPEFTDAWFLLAAMELQVGQLSQAEGHLQHYIDLISVTPDKDRRPDSLRGLSQAYQSMAHIAVQHKDYQQADAWLQRVDYPDDVLQAQIKRAGLMALQGKVDEAIALIHSQPERSKTDANTKRSAEVQILRDHALYDQARIVLEDAIAQNPQETDLVYDLSMVAEKMGNLAEMERLLRQLIAAKPDDPHAYNALGYSLADRNLRLPEARQLIAKALELAPGDPFITDSLAWTEFRMGNKADALQLLQAAFKQKPDAEIAAHLGEVLWSLEQFEDAMQIWREGLKLNPDNTTLTDTLKRLRITP